MDVLSELFNEDLFQHQTEVTVPSEHDESQAAQEAMRFNEIVLNAQEVVDQASAEAFNSGEISNEILKSQEPLRQVPPCGTLVRLGQSSRITIRSAVAAARIEQQTRDLDLTSLFTFHLQPTEMADRTSFLSQLAVADDANTQRILVKTQSTIQGYQPEMIPLPCLYEGKVTEMVEVNGKKVAKTVKKSCQNFCCANLPVCTLHLNMLATLGKYDQYTPGNDNILSGTKPMNSYFHML